MATQVWHNVIQRHISVLVSIRKCYLWHWAMYQHCVWILIARIIWIRSKKPIFKCQRQFRTILIHRFRACAPYLFHFPPCRTINFTQTTLPISRLQHKYRGKQFGEIQHLRQNHSSFEVGGNFVMNLQWEDREVRQSTIPLMGHGPCDTPL